MQKTSIIIKDKYVIIAQLYVHVCKDSHEKIAIEVITQSLVRDSNIGEAYIANLFWCRVLDKTIHKQRHHPDLCFAPHVLRKTVDTIRTLNDAYLGIHLTAEEKAALLEEVKDDIDEAVNNGLGNLEFPTEPQI